MDGQTDGRREGAGADSSPPPTEKHFTFVDTASVESRRPRLAARRHPLSHSFLKNPETLQPFLFKLLFFLFCIVSFFRRQEQTGHAQLHTLPENSDFPFPLASVL